MTPIQQLMLGVGASKKTYLDDVFSTYVYRGTGSSQNINNGINLSGEGGLVWAKNRSSGNDHHLVDTVRGKNNYLVSHTNAVTSVNSTTRLASFNNNGFSVNAPGYDYTWNKSGDDYASWTFRKSPGFFDVVTYTGTGSTRTVAHNLGCVPGLIIIKCTSNAESWIVYHRDIGAEKYLKLNSNDAVGTSSSAWNNTAPTSTHFTVSTAGQSNDNGFTYVAYVFAGGEQRGNESVKFDGTEDNLNWSSNSHLAFGTGDFTIEFWVKMSTVQDTILLDMRPNPAATNGKYPLIHYNSNQIKYFTDSSDRINGSSSFNANQWYHVAVSRSGTSTKLFLDGTQVGSTYSDSNDYLNGDTTLGSRASNTTANLDGYISNFRITKGQALYTSNFTPSTTPLTTTSQGATADNVKILCCNDTQIENYTKSTSSITLNGNPSGDKSSPFSKPIDASSVFGESGSESVIKTGSYTGNGSSTGPEINLGWEPQYILLKNADEEEQWQLFDSMRGIVANGNDEKLMPSVSSSSSTAADIIDLTPTGFKLKTSDTDYNGNNDKIIYMAIRRPDGYVGKPADAGTDVFAMDTGNNSSTIPAYDSGFPVDFALMKKPASTFDWYTGARLTGSTYMKTNSTTAGATANAWLFDSNAGWSTGQDTDRQSWMWKRHAGFDVVTYKGNGVAGRQIPHSMNKTPEMIWIRAISGGEWIVGHHGVNGGTNPWNYEMLLHDTRGEGASANKFNNTAPNSRVFTVGDNTYVNASGTNYVSMLFSSVSGISSVGSYTGNGSTTGPIITTGFQPRLIMLKRADDSGSWYLYDTLRGITSGNDHRIELNGNYGQSSGADDVDVLSTGFQLKHTWDNLNGSGGKYLYYAHA